MPGLFLSVSGLLLIEVCNVSWLIDNRKMKKLGSYTMAHHILPFAGKKEEINPSTVTEVFCCAAPNKNWRP